MMPTTRLYSRIASFALLALLACSGGKNAKMMDTSDAAAPANAQLAASDEGSGEKRAQEEVKSAAPRMVIYTATLRMQVDRLDSARNAVRRLVLAHQGYLSGESLEHRSYTQDIGMSLRVPQKHFDKVLAQLEALGSYIESKQLTSQDVTQEFVDNEARLRAKKEVEQRYIDILRRTGSITDVLAVEAQLRVIREEIEVVQGRQQYLGNQVSLSTINLTLYVPQVRQPAPQDGFFARVWEGVSSGWRGLLDFLVAILTLWPLWLAVAGGIYVWRHWRSKPKSGAGQA